MNFFGHAVVAGWEGAEPPAVLGSMLPDFETMIGVRIVEIRDIEIQQGVDLHHRTDDAFHRTPTFLSLCAEALTALSTSGVRRGTARAVAHIGTELILDGWLAANDAHANIYQTALQSDVDEHLGWADDGRAFAKLQDRLRQWGPPHDYRDPQFVLDRLQDALRSRPRLAVLDDQRQRLTEFLPTHQTAVEGRAPELLQELQNALGFDRLR